jgi:hypothetical protein
LNKILRIQFEKIHRKSRAKKLSTEKSGIILKFFDAFTAPICLRHVAPLSHATLT